MRRHRKRNNTSKQMIIVNDCLVDVGTLRIEASRAGTRFWVLLLVVSLLSSLVVPYLSMASIVASDSKVFDGDVIPGYSMGGIDIATYGVDINDWGKTDQTTETNPRVVKSNYGYWNETRAENAKNNLTKAVKADKDSADPSRDLTEFSPTDEIIGDADKARGWIGITRNDGNGTGLSDFRSNPQGLSSDNRQSYNEAVAPYRTQQDWQYWDNQAVGGATPSITATIYPDFVILGWDGKHATLLKNPDDISTTSDTAASTSKAIAGTAAIPHYLPLSTLFKAYGLDKTVMDGDSGKMVDLDTLLVAINKDMKSDNGQMYSAKLDALVQNSKNDIANDLMLGTNYRNLNGSKDTKVVTQYDESSDAWNPYPYSMVFRTSTDKGTVVSSIYGNDEAYVYFSPQSVYSNYIAMRSEYDALVTVNADAITKQNPSVSFQLGYYLAGMSILEAYLNEALPQDMTRGYVGPAEGTPKSDESEVLIDQNKLNTRSTATGTVSQLFESGLSTVNDMGKNTSSAAGKGFYAVAYSQLMYDFADAATVTYRQEGTAAHLGETNAIMNLLSTYGYGVRDIGQLVNTKAKSAGQGPNRGMSRRQNFSRITSLGPATASASMQSTTVGNDAEDPVIHPSLKTNANTGLYVPVYYPIQQHEFPKGELSYRFQLLSLIPYETLTYELGKNQFADGTSLSYNTTELDSLKATQRYFSKSASLVSQLNDLAKNSVSLGEFNMSQSVALSPQSATGQTTATEISSNRAYARTLDATGRVDNALMAFSTNNMTADNVHDLVDIIRSIPGVKYETFMRYFNPLKSAGGSTDLFVTRISPAKTAYMPSMLTYGYESAGGVTNTARGTATNAAAFDYFSIPSFSPCFAAHAADDTYYGSLTYELRPLYTEGFLSGIPATVNIPSLEQYETATKDDSSEEIDRDLAVMNIRHKITGIYILAKRLAFTEAYNTLVSATNGTDGSVSLGALWAAGLESDLAPNSDVARKALKPADYDKFNNPATESCEDGAWVESHSDERQLKDLTEERAQEIVHEIYDERLTTNDDGTCTTYFIDPADGTKTTYTYDPETDYFDISTSDSTQSQSDNTESTSSGKSTSSTGEVTTGTVEAGEPENQEEENRKKDDITKSEQLYVLERSTTSWMVLNDYRGDPNGDWSGGTGDFALEMGSTVLNGTIYSRYLWGPAWLSRWSIAPYLNVPTYAPQWMTNSIATGMPLADYEMGMLAAETDFTRASLNPVHGMGASTFEGFSGVCALAIVLDFIYQSAVNAKTTETQQIVVGSGDVAYYQSQGWTMSADQTAATSSGSSGGSPKVSTQSSGPQVVSSHVTNTTTIQVPVPVIGTWDFHSYESTADLHAAGYYTRSELGLSTIAWFVNMIVSFIANHIPQELRNASVDPNQALQQASTSGSATAVVLASAGKRLPQSGTAYDAAAEQIYASDQLQQNGYEQVQDTQWNSITHRSGDGITFHLASTINKPTQESFEYVLQGSKKESILGSDGSQKVWCKDSNGAAFVTSLDTIFKALYITMYNRHLTANSSDSYWWDTADAISTYDANAERMRFTEHLPSKDEEYKQYDTVALDLADVSDVGKARKTLDAYCKKAFQDVSTVLTSIGDDGLPEQMQNVMAWADEQTPASSEMNYHPDESDDNLVINIGDGNDTKSNFIIHNIDDLHDAGLSISNNGEDWVASPSSKKQSIQARMCRGVVGTTYLATGQLAAYTISSTIGRIDTLATGNADNGNIPYGGIYNGLLNSGTERYAVLQAHVIDRAGITSGKNGDLKSTTQSGTGVSTENPNTTTDSKNALAAAADLSNEISSSVVPASVNMMKTAQNVADTNTNATAKNLSTANANILGIVNNTLPTDKSTALSSTFGGIAMNRNNAATQKYNTNTRTLTPATGAVANASISSDMDDAMSLIDPTGANDLTGAYAVVQSIALLLVLAFLSVIAFQNFVGYTSGNEKDFVIAQTQFKTVFPRALIAVAMIGLPPMGGGVGFQGGCFLLLQLIHSIMDAVIGVIVPENAFDAMLQAFQNMLGTSGGGQIHWWTGFATVFTIVIQAVCSIIFWLVSIVVSIITVIQEVILFLFWFVGPIVWALYVWPYDGEGNNPSSNGLLGKAMGAITGKLGSQSFTDGKVGNAAPAGWIFGYASALFVIVKWNLLFWASTVVFNIMDGKTVMEAIDSAASKASFVTDSIAGLTDQSNGALRAVIATAAFVFVAFIMYRSMMNSMKGIGKALHGVVRQVGNAAKMKGLSKIDSGLSSAAYQMGTVDRNNMANPNSTASRLAEMGAHVAGGLANAGAGMAHYATSESGRDLGNRLGMMADNLSRPVASRDAESGAFSGLVGVDEDGNLTATAAVTGVGNLADDAIGYRKKAENERKAIRQEAELTAKGIRAEDIDARRKEHDAEGRKKKLKENQATLGKQQRVLGRQGKDLQAQQEMMKGQSDTLTEQSERLGRQQQTSEAMAQRANGDRHVLPTSYIHAVSNATRQAKKAEKEVKTLSMQLDAARGALAAASGSDRAVAQQHVDALTAKVADAETRQASAETKCDELHKSAKVANNAYLGAADRLSQVDSSGVAKSDEHVERTREARTENAGTITVNNTTRKEVKKEHKVNAEAQKVMKESDKAYGELASVTRQVKAHTGKDAWKHDRGDWGTKGSVKRQRELRKLTGQAIDSHMGKAIRADEAERTADQVSSTVLEQDKKVIAKGNKQRGENMRRRVTNAGVISENAQQISDNGGNLLTNEEHITEVRDELIPVAEVHDVHQKTLYSQNPN